MHPWVTDTPPTHFCTPDVFIPLPGPRGHGVAFSLEEDRINAGRFRNALSNACISSNGYVGNMRSEINARRKASVGTPCIVKCV